MNWYAYKVLADTYDADRRAQAASHRRARQAARAARVRQELDTVEHAAAGVTAGRLRSMVARVRSRRPAPAPGVGIASISRPGHAH